MNRCRLACWFMLSFFSPFSERVCYKTNLKKCTDKAGFPYFGCWLSHKGLKHFKFNKLETYTGDQGSTVFINSANDTETDSICFYSVSVAENSTGNCSGMLLQHISDHPEDSYVDRLENLTGNSTSNSTTATATTTQCRSYVKLKYTQYGRDTTSRPLCREELANLDLTLPGVTSVFIVYWTNSREINSGSFDLRARCISSWYFTYMYIHRALFTYLLNEIYPQH